MSGRPPIETVSTIIGLFLFLLPGACAAATTLFRRGWIAGAVVGTLIGVYAVTADQVFMQNAASLFGIAVGRPRYRPHRARHRRRAARASGSARDDPAAPDASAVPLWLGGVALAGLVGSYSEYLPIVAPALTLYVLLRSRAELRRVVPRAAALVGVAVIVAPLAWIRAASSLSTQGDLGNRGVGSAFLHQPSRIVLGRLAGLIPLTATDGPNSSTVGGAAILLLVALGVGVAIAFDARRRLWILLPAMTVLVVVYLSTGNRDPYSQQRAVEIGMPLLVVVAAVGYSALRERLVRGRSHKPPAGEWFPRRRSGPSPCSSWYRWGSWPS